MILMSEMLNFRSVADKLSYSLYFPGPFIISLLLLNGISGLSVCPQKFLF